MSTKILNRITSNKSIFTCIISCRCCCYYYIVCIIGWVFHMVAQTLNNFLGRTNLNEKKGANKNFPLSGIQIITINIQNTTIYNVITNNI